MSLSSLASEDATSGLDRSAISDFRELKRICSFRNLMEFVKYPSTCQLIHKKADFLAYSFSASCEKKSLCIPAEHQDYDPLRQLFLPALRREAVHTAPLRRSATCVQDIPYVNDTVNHKITIFLSAAIGDRLSE